MPSKNNFKKSRTPRKRATKKAPKRAKACINRANDALEHAVAVKECISYLIQGAEPSLQIREKLLADHPKIDVGQVLAEALDHFDQAGRQTPAVVTGLCAERARDLFQKMYGCDDFAGALAAIKVFAGLDMHEPRPDPNKPADSDPFDLDL